MPRNAAAIRRVTTRLIATGTARRLYPTASQKVLPHRLARKSIAATTGASGLPKKRIRCGLAEMRRTKEKSTCRSGASPGWQPYLRGGNPTDQLAS
jgi:hypothetical protein